MLLRLLELLAAKILLVPLEMRFNITEFVQKCVVFENFEILDVKVGLICAFVLLVGLTRVDTFENAEASKISERQLESPDCMAPCQILRRWSLRSLLEFLAHYLGMFFN